MSESRISHWLIYHPPLPPPSLPSRIRACCLHQHKLQLGCERATERVHSVCRVAAVFSALIGGISVMWLHNNRRREQGAATVASEIRKHTQGYKVAAAGRQPATENPHFQHLGFALAAAAARKEKPISGRPISVSGNRQCLLVPILGRIVKKTPRNTVVALPSLRRRLQAAVMLLRLNARVKGQLGRDHRCHGKGHPLTEE